MGKENGVMDYSCISFRLFLIFDYVDVLLVKNCWFVFFICKSNEKERVKYMSIPV